MWETRQVVRRQSPPSAAIASSDTPRRQHVPLMTRTTCLDTPPGHTPFTHRDVQCHFTLHTRTYTNPPTQPSTCTDAGTQPTQASDHLPTTVEETRLSPSRTLWCFDAFPFSSTSLACSDELEVDRYGISTLFPQTPLPTPFHPNP